MQAVNFDHHKDEVYVFKARLHKGRGEIEEALQSAHIALSINPGLANAKRVIRYLQNL
ncbi:MAG: hypothetical protein RLP44_27105 [Aggregatilineales bacterium]